MNSQMSALVGPSGATGARHFRLTRMAVYLLVLILCVPSDLYAPLMPGQRQFLLPVATGMLLLVWMLVGVGRMRMISGRVSILWTLLFVFLLWVAMASIMRPNAPQSLVLVVTYLERIVMLFVLVQILSLDWELFVRTQHLLVIGLGVLALLMLTGALNRFGGQVLATDVAGLHINRAASGLGDPNFTALVFNIGVALALGWLATTSSLWRRWLAGGMAFILVVAIGLTVSLGGVIGLMLVLWLAYRKLATQVNYQRRWVLVLLSGGMLLAIVGTTGGIYLERLQQQVARTEQSAGNFGSQRLNLALGAVRMAAANPLFGVGPVNVPANMPSYIPFASDDPEDGAHNSYVSVADESGLPAWFLIVAAAILIGKTFRRSLKNVRNSGNRQSHLIGMSIAIALIASLVQMAALDTQRQPFLWLMAALALAFSAHWRGLPSQLQVLPSEVR